MISDLTFYLGCSFKPQFEICRVEVWDNPLLLFKKETFPCQGKADRFENILLQKQLMEGLMESSAVTLIAQSWGRNLML